MDNSVCSLKASKAFPEDITDVGVGGSCVGNLGGAVGNDSNEAVQMEVSPIFHASLEKKNLTLEQTVACKVQRGTLRNTLVHKQLVSSLALDDIKIPVVTFSTI